MEGDVEQVIADVKTVSLGNKSLYKPGYGGDKAVALRASQLQGEYRRGALKVDRELGHEDGARADHQEAGVLSPCARSGIRCLW